MEENTENEIIPEVFLQALKEVKNHRQEDGWSNHTDWGDKSYDVWSQSV